MSIEASNATTDAFDVRFYASGCFIWKIPRAPLSRKCDRCNGDMEPFAHVGPMLHGHVLCIACLRALERRATLWHIAKTDSIAVRKTSVYAQCAICTYSSDGKLSIDLLSNARVCITLIACRRCFYERAESYDRSIVDELRLHITKRVTNTVTACFAHVLPLPARDTIIEMMMADFDTQVASAKRPKKKKHNRRHHRGSRGGRNT